LPEQHDRVKEPGDVLYRIKRGLAGHVSYLAACQMNAAFSEYVLYEPILRILMARGYRIECEYECPGIEPSGRGDRKRLDFYAVGPSGEQQQFVLAIEVKWVRDSRPRLESDIEKLAAVLKSDPNVLPLLCVFGRESDLLRFPPGPHFRKRGKMVTADLRKTRYSCAFYQFLPKRRFTIGGKKRSR
jgi:hypothetical protein